MNVSTLLFLGWMGYGPFAPGMNPPQPPPVVRPSKDPMTCIHPTQGIYVPCPKPRS